jgi:glycolate oxidase iron-sulfur subunit
MLVLSGCVQPTLVPAINIATAHVLDKLGITLLPDPQGCCGALSYHLAAHEKGLIQARQRIDRWWPFVEKGIEAIVITASGCGTLVKEYGYLLRHDSQYADKAAKISQLACDVVEVVAKEDLSSLLSAMTPPHAPIAVHVPCSLQHGQKLSGVLEGLLKRLGYELTVVADSHLCCGSAGVYSLLNHAISQQLLAAKLHALEAGQPQCIVTANVGCQLHLQSQAKVPVKHWIELLTDNLS